MIYEVFYATSLTNRSTHGSPMGFFQNEPVKKAKIREKGEMGDRFRLINILFVFCLD